MITPTHVPTSEASSEESAHYTEIIEDDYRRTTLQGTNKKKTYHYLTTGDLNTVLDRDG